MANEDPTPTQPNSAQPNLEVAWDAIIKQVGKYDQETYRSRQEDLNTLLVFAGLLSAVVTAFTVESYKSLRVDPADVTVALLVQISQQLAQPALSSLPIQSQPFQPTSSSVRINCFWFLSLILSLATSLFALLCKQWLHENQRDTPTHTFKDSMALRQMRRDSLEKGKVPTLVAVLPVLLELSVLIFFAGLLDLFWSLSVIPLFVVGCIIIGGSGLLYFSTTIIPGLMIVKLIRREVQWFYTMADHDRPQVYWSTWPYKSPQAWAFFRLIASVVSFAPWLLFTLNGSGYTEAKPDIRVLGDMTTIILASCSEWSIIDVLLVQLWKPDNEEMSIHLWEAMKSAVGILRGVSSLHPYLHAILNSFSPRIALPLSLPEFFRVYTWMNSDHLTVDSFLPLGSCYQHFYGLGIPSTADIVTQPEMEFILRIVANMELNKQPDYLDEFLKEARTISRDNVPKRTRINFTIFFHVAKEIWEGNRGIELLDIYKDEWTAYSDSVPQRAKRISVDGDERYQFIASFARYIRACLDHQEALPDAEPILMAHHKGLEFLRFIHNQIIEHKLYDMTQYAASSTTSNVNANSTSEIIHNWVGAMKRVQRVKKLPMHYFMELPPPNSDALDPEAPAGGFGGIRGIDASIRGALSRRTGNMPHSEA
ncbi:hypothetical protein V5O48_015583 [Marasmius crinis-equi]|uniref:DUF6535 domain-containing protein n=1 Tax=Marasmius crinis-equi TaxID=585013 RepID=A0ABR3EU54_9AGAR